MAHRHEKHKKEHEKHHKGHKKASGGHVSGKSGKGDDGIEKGTPDYSGGAENTRKEALEKKHGGKVHGHKGHHRLDKRARGGRIGKVGGGNHSPVTKTGGKDMTSSPFAPSHVHTSGDA